MDYPYDNDTFDEQPTPYHDDSMDSSSWSFHDARAGATPGHTPDGSLISERSGRRPRPSRHSSLPRTLFASGSGSLFGSGSGPRDMANEEERDGRPPLLAVTQPSQEEVQQSVTSSHTSGLQPPFSALAGSQFDAAVEDAVRSTAGRRSAPRHIDQRLVPRVEKDADDPTSPPHTSRTAPDRQQSTTLTTLSRLFAVQAAVSPDVSRHSSYLSQPQRQASGYTRNLQTTDVPDLPHHLFTRGLLEGRHSDITVNAFGHQYKLHRLILDRAPFFTSALSAPWLEANAKDITVHPEDIDASITQTSFELALKRLYGCNTLHEEDSDAVGLFATGCWLEMQDLIDSSIESMLRQMTPETLSPLIKLVTSNYYGRAGDKILASAKAMLCRDGWRMPLKYWDGIPGDIIREIVGGDGFFIDGEWDRWVLSKRLLDRRLRLRAIEAGLVQPGTRRKVRKAPDTVNLMAIRFDGVYRKNSTASTGGRGMSDTLHQWITLYTHPDVEPILVLLDEGIHYIHLDFEQLQFIRRSKDCLGLPVMPEKVISNALWQQMELRQRVMNSRETDMELNLSVKCTDTSVSGLETPTIRDTTMSITTPSEPPLPPAAIQKGKHKATDSHSSGASVEPEDEDLDSGSWDGNGKPRKFWIPSSDCNIVMGGNADPVIATSNTTTIQRHAQSRNSGTIQPEDIQWASDFSAITSQPRPPTAPDGMGGEGGMGEVRYSHFPPFRFAAEFPNPRLLKEKKRVYSRTVFYAGSLWNIYIQKVATSRNKQLGVYLHRAKERETEEVIAGTAGMAQGSVDERIGQLEREMIMRSERRQRRQRRGDRGTVSSEGHEPDGGDSSGDAAEHPLAPAGEGSRFGRAETMRNLLSRGSGKAGQTDVAASSPTGTSTLFPPNTGELPLSINPYSSSDSEDDEDEELETQSLLLAHRNRHVPTLPPYVDARPTIKTYFKIYSPSRGGRMLSVYESAPDRFNFSQSWGWKSSTLMLDEGMLGGEDEDGKGGPAGAGEEEMGTGASPGGAGEGGKVDGQGAAAVMRGRGDGKLRFMVVIGNI